VPVLTLLLVPVACVKLDSLGSRSESALQVVDGPAAAHDPGGLPVPGACRQARRMLQRINVRASPPRGMVCPFRALQDVEIAPLAVAISGIAANAEAATPPKTSRVE
jgi:hypothetical protein